MGTSGSWLGCFDPQVQMEALYSQKNDNAFRTYIDSTLTNFFSDRTKPYRIAQDRFDSTDTNPTLSSANCIFDFNPTISDGALMRQRNTLSLGLIVSLSLIGLSLQAQVVQGSKPTKAECKNAENSFATNPDAPIAFQTLPGCGRTGGKALARAFGAARAETNTAKLDEYYRSLTTIRDPEVFASAISVIKDPSASASARATAILIAVAQHDNALSPPINIPFRDLISSDQPNCRLVHSTDSGYQSSSPLAPGSIDQLRGALADVRNSSSSPTLVQAFAECALAAVGRPKSAAGSQ